MKDLFPGYFKSNEDNLKEIWSECLFVFDANILLNLYRYSDSTRGELLKILKKVNERVWMPHRAAEEYFKNRLTVIAQQERSYDDTIKSITTLATGLENARQHPFVSKKTLSRAEKVFDALRAELKENKKAHTDRILKDEIKEEISRIFDGRVGQAFDDKRLEEVLRDGKDRYKQKIPPGFRDESKANDSDVLSEVCSKYGDVIVWNQVIEKAIESGKDVAFVTDDRKDDWWEKFNGKTIGPRPELVKEFKDKTNKIFLMYQADKFLELARANLDEKVSEEMVSEVREIRRRNKQDYRNTKEFNYTAGQVDHKSDLQHKLEQSMSLVNFLNEQIEQSKEKLLELDVRQDRLRKYKEDGSVSFDHEDAESFANEYAQTLELRRQFEELIAEFEFIIKKEKTNINLMKARTALTEPLF